MRIAARVTGVPDNVTSGYWMTFSIREARSTMRTHHVLRMEHKRPVRPFNLNKIAEQTPEHDAEQNDPKTMHSFSDWCRVPS